MLNHLENCADFTSCQVYQCPECSVGHQIPDCHLDLLAMEKPPKRCIYGLSGFSGAEGSTAMSGDDLLFGSADGYQAGDSFDRIEAARTLTGLEVPEFNHHYPSGFSPIYGHNHPVNLQGSNGSPYACLPHQSLTVSIPGNFETIPGGFQQSSPEQYSLTSASTLVSSAYSSNPDQPWPTSFGKSVHCETTTPSSDYSCNVDMLFSPTMPFSAHTQPPTVWPSSHAGFAQDAVVYSTGGDDCMKSVVPFPEAMQIYSPSSDEPNMGRGYVEDPLPLHSPDASHCSFESSPMYRMLQEGFQVIEAAGSQPTGYSIENGPSNNLNGTDGTSGSSKYNDFPAPRCNKDSCNWSPGNKDKKRSEQSMKQALQKHIRRKHEAKDVTCEICKIIISKRPDNLKDHVRRKHPKKFPALYPGSGAGRRGKGGSYGSPRTS